VTHILVELVAGTFSKITGCGKTFIKVGKLSANELSANELSGNTFHAITFIANVLSVIMVSELANQLF
jgi:hypothetical protein